jgi:CheY-like chemotaxis protein
MSGQRGFILVVDDDEDIREILVLTLGEEGYRVVGVPDGLDALLRLRTEAGALLILLDLMMPRLSGADFIRALRADPRLADIPVLIMSGDTEATQTAAALGASGCLTKPMDREELVAAVGQYAGRG